MYNNFIIWHCDVSFFISLIQRFFMLSSMNNLLNWLLSPVVESQQILSLKDAIFSIFLLASVSSAENETGSIYSYFPAVHCSKGLHHSFSNPIAIYLR